MARRQLHDRYFRRAKAEGYLARSAYKLLEINQRWHVLRPGQRVLDLGCAPGSWLQVAHQAVGPHGVVVGVDVEPVRAPMPPNVRTIQTDVHILQPAAVCEAAAGVSPGLKPGSSALFDVVLSDMAPNTSGHGDDLLSARLCERVLALLPHVLRPGGDLVMKVLEGQAYPGLLRQVRTMFARAQGFRPQASRPMSREIYIVASRYQGQGGWGTKGTSEDKASAT